MFLKEGFDPRTMLAEIGLRGSGSEGPFLRIEQYDSAGGWFEEALLDAFSLPRCPPWFPREKLQQQALRVLETWALNGAEPISTGEYIDKLVSQIEGGLSDIQTRFNAKTLVADLSAHLGWLTKFARDVSEILLVDSHGDFQPGNIMVGHRTREVTIIDWEHFDRRSRFYDKFVLAFQSRSARGLAARITSFITCEKTPKILGNISHERISRRAQTSLFLLEDLNWFIRESQTGPFSAPSQGLVLYQNELASLRYTIGNEAL